MEKIRANFQDIHNRFCSPAHGGTRWPLSVIEYMGTPLQIKVDLTYKLKDHIIGYVKYFLATSERKSGA